MQTKSCSGIDLKAFSPNLREPPNAHLIMSIK